MIFRGDRERRLKHLDAPERFSDSNQRATNVGAPKAGRGFDLRNREKKRQRARACDDRDVFAVERFSIRFSEWFTAIDPQRRCRCHRELAQIIKRFRPEVFLQHASCARIVTANACGAKAWVREHARCTCSA